MRKSIGKKKSIAGRMAAVTTSASCGESSARIRGEPITLFIDEREREREAKRGFYFCATTCSSEGRLHSRARARALFPIIPRRLVF